MEAWDVFKRRHPWINEVLTKRMVRHFTATRDAAHLMAEIEQQLQLTSRMNYFAALLKAEIDELRSDIERITDNINELNAFRKELEAVELELDRALIHYRTLRKVHTVRRLVDNEMIDQLTGGAIHVARVYAQTKTQPDVIRRVDLVQKELQDSIEILNELTELRGETEKTEKKETGGETE